VRFLSTVGRSHRKLGVAEVFSLLFVVLGTAGAIRAVVDGAPSRLLLVVATTAFFLALYLIPRFLYSDARALPESAVEDLLRIPPMRPNAHLVDLRLVDGRTIEGIHVAYGRYLVPMRRRPELFDPKTVISAHPHVPGGEHP